MHITSMHKHMPDQERPALSTAKAVQEWKRAGRACNRVREGNNGVRTRRRVGSVAAMHTISYSPSWARYANMDPFRFAPAT